MKHVSLVQITYKTSLPVVVQQESNLPWNHNHEIRAAIEMHIHHLGMHLSHIGSCIDILSVDKMRPEQVHIQQIIVLVQ